MDQMDSRDAQMERVLQTLDLDTLLIRVSSLNDNKRCSLIRSSPLRGEMNLVFPIVFPETGKKCCARVPFSPDLMHPDTIARTARLLRFVEEYFLSVPAPRLIDFDTNGSYAGTPFYVLTWAEGRVLADWSDVYPPPDERWKVLEQIAHIRLRMVLASENAPKERIASVKGPVPDATAREWYLTVVDRRISRCLDGQWPTSQIDVLARFLVRSKVLSGQYIASALNDVPYVLDHGDMNANNIVVDEEWNITGVLDWDCFTTWIPAQAAAQYPTFIRFRPEDPSLYVDDRAAYLKCYRALEREATGQENLSDVLGNEELVLFHQALWEQKQLWPIFAERYCSRSLVGTGKTRMDILKALDDFISRFLNYRENELLERVRKDLVLL